MRSYWFNSISGLGTQITLKLSLLGDNEEDGISSPVQSQVVSESDVSTVLVERLKTYEVAESNAKSAGETSKARRYGRAIKTLKDLIKQAKSGKVIDLNADTVPPEIHVGEKKPNGGQDHLLPSPSRPAPAIPAPAIPAPAIPMETTSSPELPTVVQENVEKEKRNIDEELLKMLTERQKEYKIAALKAKKSGDPQTAMKFVKVAKQFEIVIEAVKNGQNVDLSDMPGSPSEIRDEPKLDNNETQHNCASDKNDQDVSNIPQPTHITATTVLEALEQRLGKVINKQRYTLT